MFYQSLQHVRCKGCQPDMRRRRVPVGARKSGDRPMRRQRWSGSACSKEGGSEISSDSASIRPCWICPRGQSVREPTVSEFSTFRSKTNVRPLPFDRTAPAHVTTRPPIHCTVHPQATLTPPSSSGPIQISHSNGPQIRQHARLLRTISQADSPAF